MVLRWGGVAAILWEHKASATIFHFEVKKIIGRMINIGLRYIHRRPKANINNRRTRLLNGNII